jgi:hypothetical protein
MIETAERFSRQTIAPSGGNVTLRSSQPHPVTGVWSVEKDGAEVATGSVTSVAVGSGSVVSAAIGSLVIGEGYRLTLPNNRVVLFDVARDPYGPFPTLGDLVSERPDVVSIVNQTVSVLGGLPLTTEIVVENAADRARATLDDLLRTRLVESPHPSIRQLELRFRLPRDQLFLRGYLILDSDRVRRIERYLTIYELFMQKVIGRVEDSSQALASAYFARAKAALHSMGPLRVDADGTGVPYFAGNPRKIRVVRVRG